MQPSATAARTASNPPRIAAPPAWLAVAMLPDADRPRASALQRQVAAVVGFLTGNHATVTHERLLDQWPSWLPRPHEKTLSRTIRRLVDRGVVVLLGGRGYRLDRDLADAAARRGARFRFVPSDFTAELSVAEVDVLALLRGMRSARGHSAGWLAELLGRDEKTVRTVVGSLRTKGLLHDAGETRFRNGSRVPIVVVREQETGTVRPVAGTVRPVVWNRSPDNLYPPGVDPTGSDHPATPSAKVEPSPATRPAAPDQNGARGADDPIRERVAEQKQKPETVAVVTPPWIDVERREAAAIAARATWDGYRDHLQAAVAELHLAPATVDNLNHALVAIGVYLPFGSMAAAGRAGLRRQRVAMAEQLAAEKVEPSTVLEVAFVRMRDVQAPQKMGADLRVILQPKGRDYVQRSNDRVEAGEGPLPMAAGAAALDRLVMPQARPVGSFAYPKAWWHDAVGQAVRERLANLRGLVAATAETMVVREANGQVAAEILRQKLGAAERQRREREQARELDSDSRRARGRLIGAATAGDWRRLATWLPKGITLPMVADWSNVPLATIEAGIAEAARAATA